MIDYFGELLNYIQMNYKFVKHKVQFKKENKEVRLPFEVSESIREIYINYSQFEILWCDENGKIIGEVEFIPDNMIIEENKHLIEIMKDLYDIEEDELGIKDDIMNWYPVFWFDNGDAFCVDSRNGKIVFYEHEVYDAGKNLHGLVLAQSLDELFSKWWSINFANVYYWDEIVDANGIDLNSELAKRYLH